MKLGITILTVACATGCMSVKPFDRDIDGPKLLHIEEGQINMVRTARRKGSPTLLVWSYTTNTPLWSIAPTQKKIRGKAPLSFAYGEVPTDYTQKHPSVGGSATLPAKGDIVIFLLVFTHETVFAPSGSHCALAYAYDGVDQWRKVPVPEDAYTPEGWQ